MSASKVSVCVLVVLAVIAIIEAMPAPGGHGGHGGGYGGGGNSHIFRNDHGYDNYDFGYDTSDHYTGDNHGRRESKKGYNVVGSYHLSGPYGHGRKVNYVADHYGTHQTIHGSQNGLYVDSPDVKIVPGYGH